MRSTILRIFLLAIFSLSWAWSFGQTSPSIFSNVPLHNAEQFSAKRVIAPEKFRLLELNANELETSLSNLPQVRHGLIPASGGNIIELPHPDGHSTSFRVWEAPIMAPELAERFPHIKTYKGVAADGSGAVVRFDQTPQGFHAQVLSKDGAWYIDPIAQGNTSLVQSYWKADYHNPDKVGFEELIDPASMNRAMPQASASASVGERLKSYRLAMACTGEYAQFHGGVVADVLAAMVTTVNRINGIYERELSITLEMIGNNDQLIFLDGSSDPYTNGNTGTMLNQNQSTCNSVIGSSNYDIGHVVGTGNGGIASLGSVCSNQNKAKGATGLNAPVGDSFDVDYVAHEMGHQFGATHTFNSNSGSCNGNGTASTAFEPGSGSTIMAYAGICGGHNLQNNSDDYFHFASFDQITAYTETDDGQNCVTEFQTGNFPPTVVAGNVGFTIPMETPFRLTAESADDVNGDSLTYCWEEADLGPFGHPDNPTGNAPILRSLPPETSPTRVFPQSVALLNNLQLRGEILPFTNRILNWRVTVRDNNGGVGYDETEVDVTTASGPFLVSDPNAGGNFFAGEPYTVTWDVANTTASPVNCQTVNLLASDDGGLTWNYTVANGLPNNGSADIVMPNIETTEARIMVEAADNIFFDITDEDFELSRLSKDVGISGFASPKPWIDQTQTSVTVYLQNFGQQDASNFTISYSVNGGTPNAETYAGTLAAGATELYTFNTPLKFRGNGLIELCASVSGVSGDAEPGNDTRCREIPVVLATEFPADQPALISKLYPVPASNQLMLEFGSAIGNYELRVLDVFGKIVSQSRVTFAGSHQQHQLDLSQFAAGSYFIQIGNAQQTTTKRFTIVR